MKDAIGYLRVSTHEQGRSGLSLAAQRFDIEAFGKREAFAITARHQAKMVSQGSIGSTRADRLRRNRR